MSSIKQYEILVEEARRYRQIRKAVETTTDTQLLLEQIKKIVEEE